MESLNEKQSSMSSKFNSALEIPHYQNLISNTKGLQDFNVEISTNFDGSTHLAVD